MAVAVARIRAGGQRSLIAALVLVVALGALTVAAIGRGAAATKPPSTYEGTQLTVGQVIQLGYDGGFRTEDQLLAVVAIGIQESSLWTKARNWHTEFGYRPASDVIGVTGPAEAWSADHKQQLHSDRGVWQISSYWWHQYTDAQTDNPTTALQAMWTISSSGTNFSLWDTYSAGAAQRHYDQAVDGWPALRPLVRQFLAQSPTPPATTQPPSTTTPPPTTQPPTTTKPPATTLPTTPPATTPPTTTAQEWRADRMYHTGDQVTWHGNAYTAKWYSLNVLPDAPVAHDWDTPWRLTGTAAPAPTPPSTTVPPGTYPTWSASVAYVGGSRVIYQGVAYQAKWWTQGSVPGANVANPWDTPWQRIP